MCLSFVCARCQYTHLSSAFASSPVSISTVQQALLKPRSFYQIPAHSSCLIFFITVITESPCSWKELPLWSNLLQTGLEQLVSQHIPFLFFSQTVRMNHFGISSEICLFYLNEFGKIKLVVSFSECSFLNVLLHFYTF